MKIALKTGLFVLYAALFGVLPWSWEWRLGAHALEIPAEPLLLACALGLAVYVRTQKEVWREAVGALSWFSPIIWWGLYWVWSVVGAATSSMPWVSWKYVVVEGLHGWVFLGGAWLLPAWRRRAFPIFLYSMGAFVGYALVHHAFYGFRADQSLLAPMPFFPDHTLYAAVLAGALPFALRVHKGLAALMLVGLWFADCRAAWLSLGAAAVAAWGLLGWPLPVPRWATKRPSPSNGRPEAIASFLPPTARWVWAALLAFGLCGAGLGLGYWPQRFPLRDVSASERLNRYRCATDMAAARPWIGFGPGTFQFQYLPFQRPEFRTRISVDAPINARTPDTYGRGGGAHSEYLQALATLGWPGFVFFAAFVLAALSNAARQFLRTPNPLALCVFCSLFACFSHAAVNDLLHDGAMAVVVLGAVGWGGGGVRATARVAPTV